MMDNKEKQRLLALIEAKKKGKGSPLPGVRDLYKADGQRRKGIKSRKQGGLFDK